MNECSCPCWLKNNKGVSALQYSYSVYLIILMLILFFFTRSDKSLWILVISMRILKVGWRLPLQEMQGKHPQDAWEKNKKQTKVKVVKLSLVPVLHVSSTISQLKSCCARLVRPTPLAEWQESVCYYITQKPRWNSSHICSLAQLIKGICAAHNTRLLFN